MNPSNSNNNCFKHFKQPISHLEIPEKFTYPFYYEPHPLCLIASQELQEYLLTQQDWQHDFGIDHYVEGTNIGKMFGVMVVQKQNGELGYLAAFSGKLAGTNLLPGFVPPIYDLLDENGFFRKEEDLISAINHQINALEKSSEYMACQHRYEDCVTNSEKELQDYRYFMKTAKELRKTKRNKAKNELKEEDFAILTEKLKQESLKHQYDFKQLRNHWREQIALTHTALNEYQKRIKTLKEERKKRSAALQQKLFDQYQFLNFKGDTLSAGNIFAHTAQKVPPAGAGDCAAPKMLQYAYENKLKPIAMAEFWWGQSPKSEIRKHGYFYPSCRSKCEPILGHMLQGLSVDANPIQNPGINNDDLKIVFEDDDIVIVNKPAEFLSVPGKETEESVWLRMRQKYPDATGPLLVHRLDMSTSGLIIVAKNKEAHKILQKQFLDRSIQKRYVALLDGIVEADEGFIELPLRVDLDDRPRQLVCYDYGKPAKTKFKVLERNNGKTRVHFFPLTGRTHQLRVHAAHSDGLNTPIVGDDLYGKKDTRLHLHAEFLEFMHPLTHQMIKVKTEVDF